MTETSQSHRNIPQLDGLRGVAILLVFLTHLVALHLSESSGGVDGAARWVARFGWTGVDLFFVLSGFLITGILLDTKGKPHYWRNYAARRCLRIFPLYYGVLILLFIVLPNVVNWRDPGFLTLRANQVWYWTYLVNLLEALKGPASVPLNTSHFWSLCIEEQFYLVWPLVVLLVTPRTILKIAAGAVVFGLAFRVWLILAHADPAAPYILTPGRLDGLMIGAALAVTVRAGGLERWRSAAGRLFLGGAAVVIVLALWRGMEYRDPVMAVAGFPVIAMTFGALLVLALTSSGRLRSALSQPHLRSWGKYSYGLYLLHYPIIGALDDKLGNRFSEMTWRGSHLPGVLALTIVAVPLTYGMAWASYHLWEKRFLALKRYFV